MNISDIIGPIMVGPSSSHTAGAVRLAHLAKNVFGQTITSAELYLHGSFAQTYKGHGTDLALVAGLLGYKPSDERIPDSFEYARQAGLNFCIRTIDLGKLTHPNTVKFVMHSADGSIGTVIGSSLGGGMVKISQVDDFIVDFNGQSPVLLTQHKDRPGIIAQVTGILATQQINIAQMRVFRQTKGGMAAMVLEIDQPVDHMTLQVISKIADIHKIRSINNVEA